MGLLNWITQGSPEELALRELYGPTAAANTMSGNIDPYEATGGLPGFNFPTDEAFWRSMGYQGPVMAPTFDPNASEGAGMGETMAPQLLQYIEQNGLRPAAARNGNSGHMGVTGRDGTTTQATQWNMGDHQFWNAAQLAALATGQGVGTWANMGNGLGAAAGGGLSGVDAAMVDMGAGATNVGSGYGTLGTIPAGSAQVAPLATTGAEVAPTIASVPSAAGPTAGGLLTLENAATASAIANAADGSDYSNEGNNYPTPESTQGPGGSPVNAGGYDWSKAPGAVLDWMRANPAAGRLLMGGLVAGASAGGGGSSGGGYTDSGYRPTVSRGGWSPTATPTQTQAPQRGLITMPTAPGYENSGLWRYGLLGGG